MLTAAKLNFHPAVLLAAPPETASYIVSGSPTTAAMAHSSVRLLRQRLANQLDPLPVGRIASTAKASVYL
jgi:hypothetical protein